MQSEQPDNFNEFGASSFVVKTGDGVFVDLSKLESSEQFSLFAERVFSTGYFFSDLDYTAFLELLSEYTPEMIAAKNPSAVKRSGTMRFASDIVVFPPERLKFYRDARISSGKAEYLFESILIDKTVEEPLYAENADGVQEVVGVEQRTVTVKDALSFDEFVAAMWMKGIRFGIDADAVKSLIASGKTGRFTFASALPPSNGQDSSLKEETSKLHRDNSPRRLSDGRFDLKQFSNRFPQIREGERLLRKSPRVLGTPGMDLTGKPIEPPLPEDFDLSALAGEGTRIETTADGEFIVASISGFLNIDTATNRIAVMEKIVNYSGVSMKTTGDISLDVEHFEEHGEVQENRVVEGKNITLMSNVFGKVVSSGGKVLLKRNLVGGSAANHDGDITVEGLLSSALVHARHGTASIKRAENSLIVGERVVVESAKTCTIVGEAIEIEIAEGCAVAGKEIHIKIAHSLRDVQTVVSVLVPDLSGFRARTAEIGNRIDEIGLKIEERRRKYAAITEQTDVRSYLLIAGKVQRKEIILTDEQKANWQRLGAKIAPELKVISSVNSEIRALQEEQKELEEEVVSMEQEGKEASRGISCTIDSVAKDTMIWKRHADPVTLFDLPHKELRARLLASGLPEDRLPLGNGKYFWECPVG